MRTNRQAFLNQFPALGTVLCGEARIDSNDLMSSVCRFDGEYVEKRAPTGVHDAFCEMVVLHHIPDLKVLYRNMLIAFSIGLGRLKMMVSTLPIDLQMRLGNIARCFAETVAFLLASSELTLLAPKLLLRGTIESGSRNGVPFAIRQEGLQPNINPDVRMLACTWGMFCLRLALTDNEGIPMAVSPQDEMNRLRCSFDRPMEFDLERLSYLRRHNEMFLIFMQIDIFAVLPQLDRVPPVRFLEAGEAAFLTKFFHGKKSFQGLGEPVCQHLYCGRWYRLFALPLERCFQFIFVRESTSLIVLLLGYRPHLIIDTTCFCLTGNEPGVLLLIHEQPVFKCPHEDILQHIFRVIKEQAQPLPQRKKAHFNPMHECNGTHAPIMVES